MGYAEGNTHGFTREDAEMERKEYIMDNLLDIICKEVEACCACEGIELSGENATYVLKNCLAPHYEPVPCSDWYRDEYGNEVQDYEDELVNGSYDTYDDDIAYIGGKCGLTLHTSFDWIDGSPSYALTLPTTYEEYMQNVEEGTKFWNEVMAD